MTKSSTHLSDAHVLVIDDDPESQFLVCTLLKRAGIRTTSAHTAVEGRHLLEQEDFHLLILDGILPDMDGLDLLEILRQDTRFDDLPILILSGRADPGVIDRALELGADSCLIKPCLPRKLRQQVISILARQRRQTPLSDTTCG